MSLSATMHTHRAGGGGLRVYPPPVSSSPFSSAAALAPEPAAAELRPRRLVSSPESKVYRGAWRLRRAHPQVGEPVRLMRRSTCACGRGRIRVQCGTIPWCIWQATGSTSSALLLPPCSIRLAVLAAATSRGRVLSVPNPSCHVDLVLPTGSGAHTCRIHTMIAYYLRGAIVCVCCLTLSHINCCSDQLPQ